jgi:hypothetical protein
MAKIAKTIVNRTGAFLAAWREMAPDAVFAGMTLAEFEVASAPPLDLRDEIVAIERLREGKKAEKLKWEEEKRREFLTTDYADYTDCEERRGGGVDEAFLGFG